MCEIHTICRSAERRQHEADQLEEQRQLEERAAILKGGNDAVAVVLRNVGDKYQDVLKLEQSLRELHQMFVDMAFMVEQQGEMLDQIEFQVNSAVEYIGEGNQELGKAIEYRKKLRKKWCCLAFLLLILIAIVLGPIFSSLGIFG